MRATSLIPFKPQIRQALRYLALRRALRPLKTTGEMTESEIYAFHRAWDNHGFAADKTYLATLLSLLKTGPALECGTGGTTLLAGELGRQNGFNIYCLEQDLQWAVSVRRLVSQNVRILDTPLREYGGYHWYDVTRSLPQHFSLVICDGPYIDHSLGEPSYSAWRYGVLPWFRQNEKTFDVLLLDDVDDPRGPELLRRWEREFGVLIERVKSEDGELAIIRSRTS